MTQLTLALYQAQPALRTAAQALADLDTSLAEAARMGAQLLVTPELFLCGYGSPEAARGMAQQQNSPLLVAAAQLAARHCVGLVLGYPERDGTELYNSAIVFGCDGKLLHNYRKTMMPNDFERGCFACGNGPRVFDFQGIRCAVVICYDVEFPELPRHAALAGVELLIVPTALRADWRVVSDCVIPARAYENGIFVAYCDFAAEGCNPVFAGGSMVCGPDGRRLAVPGPGQELYTATVATDGMARTRSDIAFLKDLPQLETSLGRAVQIISAT
ncbi:hydrolase [Leisingera sp. S132]|uniref:nitrilase-related carbon-nitrogen hydrolase n=1 Tax=Leisingera sp. S132 TaxID=2867016 RepID=UPI0021A3D89B|nr:nitrilase-related carbon-nitrogen hydrolase [Leisingera sp. S132]UWQ79712.1 hydrolase [Leisingera sp. S132]